MTYGLFSYSLTIMYYNSWACSSEHFWSFFKKLNLTTTAYHLQTSRQVEQYNGILVTRLLHHVSESQRYLDSYVQALMNAYNTHTHRATGSSPLFTKGQGEPSATALGGWTRPASGIPRDTKSQQTNQRLLTRIQLIKAAVKRRMLETKK